MTTWSVVTGEYLWPKALETKQYALANKKGGLTDLLSNVDTAHEQWKRIGNWPGGVQGRVSTTRARSLGQDVLDFFKAGAPPKLRGACEIIAKRAAVISKDSKASKEARKAALAIGTAAGGIAEFMEGGSLTTAVNKAVNELVDASKRLILARMKNVFVQFKAVADKGHPGLWAARAQLQNWPADAAGQDQALQRIGTSLYDDCRDMTQNVANMVKAIDEGLDLTEFGVQPSAIKTLPGLSKGLVPIANSKAGVTNGLDRAAVTKLVAQIERDAALYDKIADKLP
jgi:hypothetical protein